MRVKIESVQLKESIIAHPEPIQTKLMLAVLFSIDNNGISRGLRRSSHLLASIHIKKSIIPFLIGTRNRSRSCIPIYFRPNNFFMSRQMCHGTM